MKTVTINLEEYDLGENRFEGEVSIYDDSIVANVTASQKFKQLHSSYNEPPEYIYDDPTITVNSVYFVNTSGESFEMKSEGAYELVKENIVLNNVG